MNLPPLPEPDIQPDEARSMGLEEVPYFSADTVRQAQREAVAADRAQIVITTNEAGQICMVSRQDEEGRILSILAESEQAVAAAVPEQGVINKIKVLADEYASRCSEFARSLALGKPDGSMSPVSSVAGDARMALHDAIGCAFRHQSPADRVAAAVLESDAGPLMREATAKGIRDTLRKVLSAAPGGEQ